MNKTVLDEASSTTLGVDLPEPFCLDSLMNDTQRRQEQCDHDSHISINRRKDVVERKVGERVDVADACEHFGSGEVEPVGDRWVGAEAGGGFHRSVVEGKVSAAGELVLNVDPRLWTDRLEHVKVVLSLVEGVEPDYGADDEDDDAVSYE